MTGPEKKGSAASSASPPVSSPALADDCFAHDGKRLKAAEALSMLRARIRPAVGAEEVPLRSAHGRYLAQDVIAGRDVPAFDNVAVDGFAFAHRGLDPAAPTRLLLAEGRAAAGHPFRHALPPGHAVRVLTGGKLPKGADSAIMQEDARVEDGALIVPPGLRRGANCRLAGEDMRAGQTVLRAGRRLRPQEIGVAAALGHGGLAVFRRLEVALVSSGDELCEPGAALGEGMTYDSNRSILHGLLRGLGASSRDQGIIADRPEAVERALERAAAGHRAIITSGGASRGDEDHMVKAAQKLGRLHFWQIAVKPGRPLAFGQIGDAVFIGLPGNPVAAMICFLRFARPVLTVLAGGIWPEPTVFRVASAFAMSKKPGRLEYLRARLLQNPADGGTDLRVSRIEREGSGILTSLCEADGLVELGEDVTEVRKGDLVPFVPFTELGLAG